MEKVNAATDTTAKPIALSETWSANPSHPVVFTSHSAHVPGRHADDRGERLRHTLWRRTNIRNALPVLLEVSIVARDRRGSGIDRRVAGDHHHITAILG